MEPSSAPDKRKHMTLDSGNVVDLTLDAQADRIDLTGGQDPMRRVEQLETDQEQVQEMTPGEPYGQPNLKRTRRRGAGQSQSMTHNMQPALFDS
eukprot:gene10262-21410_t